MKKPISGCPLRSSSFSSQGRTRISGRHEEQQAGDLRQPPDARTTRAAARPVLEPEEEGQGDEREDEEEEDEPQVPRREAARKPSMSVGRRPEVGVVAPEGRVAFAVPPDSPTRSAAARSRRARRRTGSAGAWRARRRTARRRGDGRRARCRRRRAGRAGSCATARRSRRCAAPAASRVVLDVEVLLPVEAARGVVRDEEKDGGDAQPVDVVAARRPLPQDGAPHGTTTLAAPDVAQGPPPLRPECGIQSTARRARKDGREALRPPARPSLRPQDGRGPRRARVAPAICPRIRSPTDDADQAEHDQVDADEPQKGESALAGPDDQEQRRRRSTRGR